MHLCWTKKIIYIVGEPMIKDNLVFNINLIFYLSIIIFIGKIGLGHINPTNEIIKCIAYPNN